ncbi:hypothetical protein ILYODFUR_035719 [Ilyodon furcidens]|uniref:Uncharacterized protein n=1 Tax=Ilyodon furcidens TaxID=33524 RepID=A0ABV0UBW0_9TELE
MEQEQPMKKETFRKGEEDAASTPLEQKRRLVRSKRGKKRMKQDDERITNQAEKSGAKLKKIENEEETSSTCEGAVLTKKMKLISSSVKPSHGNLLAVKSSFEEKIEALADLEEPLSAKAAKQNNVVTDVEELKEINKAETNLLSSNSPTTGTSQEETHSS